MHNSEASREPEQEAEAAGPDAVVRILVGMQTLKKGLGGRRWGSLLTTEAPSRPLGRLALWCLELRGQGEIDKGSLNINAVPHRKHGCKMVSMGSSI